MPVVLQPNVKSSELDVNCIAQIAAELHIVRPLAEVMYTRGFADPDSARHFLFETEPLHEPELLCGMSEAAACIREAVAAGEKIVVYGDYDVDGVCATAILVLALRAMGAEVSYYIPSRKEEGYGLNMAAAQELARQYELIITVDCGISSKEEVRAVQEVGGKIIVTDHHSLPPELPQCCIINPKLPDQQYPFTELCGAGVAFKLASCLLGQAAQELLDLAAIATIADMVSLKGENRTVVKMGLEHINRKTRPGLLALIRAAELTPGEIQASNIAFKIAPCINAAGRLETAQKALELLLGIGDIEQRAAELVAVNQKRQTIEAQIAAEAIQMAISSGQVRERKILILAGEGWDKGVIGIVASRLVERFHRPCIVFSVEGQTATGSARSIAGINMFELLQQNAELFIKFGGHEMAAGMTLSVDNLPLLLDNLDETIKQTADEKCFFPIVRYDARACVSEINVRLCEQLHLLEPCGLGNPAPKFRLDGLLASNRHVIGKRGDHLKIGFCDSAASIEGLAFRYESMGIDVRDGFSYNVIGVPMVSTFNHVTSVSLRLDAARQVRDLKKLCEKIDLLDERLTGVFLEQLMYGGEDVCSGNVFDDEEEFMNEMLSLLMEDVAGTFILCSHPAAAKRIAAFIFENSPRTDIAFFNTVNCDNGYNTLLIGADIETVNLGACRNILLCDAVGSHAVNALAERAPHAEILLLQNDMQALLSALPKGYADISRETFAEIYKAVRAHCLRGGLYSDMAALEDALCKERMTLNRALLHVAIPVFVQLGFIKIAEQEGKIGLRLAENMRPTPLTQSEFYRNMADCISV